MNTKVESYGFFNGFHLAFYKKAFYRYVVQNWKWRALAHVIILLLIIWAFVIGRGTYNFYHRGPLFVAAFAQQMPTLTLKDGVASTEKKGLVNIYYPGTKNAFAMVDMNKTAEQLAKLSPTAVIFLTKNSIGVRGMGKTISTKPYPKDYTGKFGPKQLEAVFKKDQVRLMAGFALVGYLIGLPFFFIGVMVYLSVLTTFVGLFASGFATPLKWRQCFSLACAAATPVLILFTIAYTVNRLSSLMLLLFLAVQFVYLLLAVGFVSELHQKRG